LSGYCVNSKERTKRENDGGFSYLFLRAGNYSERKQKVELLLKISIRSPPRRYFHDKYSCNFVEEL